MRINVLFNDAPADQESNLSMALEVTVPDGLSDADCRALVDLLKGSDVVKANLGHPPTVYVYSVQLADITRFLDQPGAS